MAAGTTMSVAIKGINAKAAAPFNTQILAVGGMFVLVTAGVALILKKPRSM